MANAYEMNVCEDLGFEGSTTDAGVLNESYIGVVVGTSCDYIGTDEFSTEGEDACFTNGVSTVNLNGNKIKIHADFFSAPVALNKLMAGELSGDSCTITGTDPNTAVVDCSEEEPVVE